MTATVSEAAEPTKRPIVWPQWLAATDVFLLSIVVGLIGGWTSPYLAKFKTEESELEVTADESSWIAAIVGIGRVFGAMLGVIVIDNLGSKKAVLSTGLTLILGWGFLLAADSVMWIYISRVLSGIGMGMYYSTFPLYIGEISYPTIRGSLVGMVTQGLPVGAVLGSLIGAYTPMWIFSCVALVMNVGFVVLFYMKPDSPHYLVSKDRLDDAKKSLEWYNRGVDVTQELESIIQFTSFKKGITYADKFREMAQPANFRAVMMVNIVYILVQLSGLWTMSFYMQIILVESGVTVIDPALVVIITGLLGIVAGWTTTYTNDACGRKIILALSSLGVAISLAALGTSYQLLDLGFDTREKFMQWLPIASVIGFQMSLAIGIMPVPSTLISEMFPANIKSLAACIINMTSATFAFLTSKTYHPMVELMTEKYVFWIYAVLMLILAAYSLFVLPETKGKSLLEIQEILSKKKKTSYPFCKETVIASC